MVISIKEKLVSELLDFEAYGVRVPKFPYSEFDADPTESINTLYKEYKGIIERLRNEHQARRRDGLNQSASNVLDVVTNTANKVTQELGEIHDPTVSLNRKREIAREWNDALVAHMTGTHPKTGDTANTWLFPVEVDLLYTATAIVSNYIDFDAKPERKPKNIVDFPLRRQRDPQTGRFISSRR